jgi:hypothetical protein
MDRTERGSEEGVYQLAMSVEAVSADAVVTVAAVAAAAAIAAVAVAAAAAAAAAVVVAAEIVVVEIAAEQIVVESMEARLETWYGDSERPCVRESNWEVKGMGDYWGKAQGEKEKEGEIDV